MVPFTSPPLTCTMIRCSPLPTFSEPWNIMCSNRCANPVCPGSSFLRTHVERQAERYGRRRMVFREHDAQAVFQRELLNGNLQFLSGGGTWDREHCAHP